MKKYLNICGLFLGLSLPIAVLAGKHSITYTNSNAAFDGAIVSVIDITDNHADTLGKGIVKNSKFSFERAYSTSTENRVIMLLFAKPGSQSSPKIFLPVSSENIILEDQQSAKVYVGSSVMKDYGTMLGQMAEVEKKGATIQQDFEAAQQAGDGAKAAELEKKSNSLRTDYFKSVSDFTSKHKDHPMASFIMSSVIEMLSGYEDEKGMYDIATQLGKNQPASLWAQNVAKSAQAKMSLSTGSLATDFSLKSLQGKDVKLSDFKGKYVLIDFWASWCGPCRKEIPNLKKAYSKYAGKDFEILGVSIDQSADKWKQAISDDHTTWVHVLDNGSGDARPSFIYRVESIPRTFLLDKEGKIIAANLRGEALLEKLDEIFKK